MLDLGPLTKRYRAYQGQMLVVTDFRKVHSMGHWRQLEQVSKLGGVGSQRITRVGKTILTMSMETQTWHPPAGSVRGGLSEGKIAFAITSVWEKAVLPALTGQFSFPQPLVSLAPLKMMRS